MSSQRRFLKASIPELCAGCHAQVLSAANAETGHPPAAEDCSTCHQPHASANLRLLTENPPDLCLMCHDGDDAELTAAHLGAAPGALDCLGCHAPHGAGNVHLLARNVHPPVLDGCDTCHEGAFSALVEDGESALCLACHDDIGERAASAATPHPAMEMVRCADCHNPHASPQPRLVKDPGGAVCTVCHEDQVAADGTSGHAVVDLIGCHACHEPHGGDTERMLRRTGSDLCLSCHDRRRVDVSDDDAPVRVLDRFDLEPEEARAMASLILSADGERNHPVTGHRVIGTPTEEEVERAWQQSSLNFKGEMGCASCHVPHLSEHDALLRWAPNEVCVTCHPK